MSDLVATLDVPVPGTLPAGTATAVFLCGSCLHPEQEVAALELVVGGERHAPTAFGMREGRFWGIARVPAQSQAGSLPIEALATLADGSELTASLGALEVTEPPPERPRGEDLIVVCMATYEPDMELFRAQLDSLRAQTDEDWVCVISDDASIDASYEGILAAVGEDDRFEVSRASETRGFYENFERALRMAPSRAGLVAFCDQDDSWHPDKLAALRAGLGSAGLVYCDQRIVDADGHVRSETLWKGRRNNHTDLSSLLVANSVTGAGMLFRRAVADLALPFPERHGFRYHDHWLALVALAAGDVAYVDRPLYEYVQHAGGHTGDPLTRPGRGGVRGAIVRWRALYFYGYLPRALQARTLLTRREGRVTPDKRRALERFLAAEHSPVAFARLALRSPSSRRETLGTEIELAQGIVWKWLATLSARLGRPLDAGLPPPDYFHQPRLERWRGSVR